MLQLNTEGEKTGSTGGPFFWPRTIQLILSRILYGFDICSGKTPLWTDDWRHFLDKLQKMSKVQQDKQIKDLRLVSVFNLKLNNCQHHNNFSIIKRYLSHLAPFLLKFFDLINVFRKTHFETDEWKDFLDKLQKTSKVHQDILSSPLVLQQNKSTIQDLFQI